MKRIRFLMLGMLLVSAPIMLSACGSSHKDSTVSNSAVNFTVISDTHITTDNTKFDRALKAINQNIPNSDALCILGDLTDHGAAAEYDNFNSTLSSNPHAPLYTAVGNHDVRNYTSFSEAKTMYLNKTGMPGLYYDKWVKGYHFIFLGSEDIVTSYTDPNSKALSSATDYAFLSDTQLNWLDTKLAENASSTKPVFVFLHQTPANTVAGSSRWPAVIQDSQLKAVLGKYPQSILFTGHLHVPVETANNVYEGKFTQINDSSVDYLWAWTDDSDPNGGHGVTGSEGLFVSVNQNKVVVKGYDFLNSKYTSFSYTKTL